MATEMAVETRDYDGIKERVFRGRLDEVLNAAAEFVRSNTVVARSIQTLEITAEKWRIAVFYREIE